ncbi:MAG: DUF3820 family protein [Kineosporiaceae bacterium]|nr:DUF3820 family protein [Kineosporiaceae bacterium]
MEPTPFTREDLVRLVSWHMPFGRYQGRLLADLPGEYLGWFARVGYPDGDLGHLLAVMHEISHNGLRDLLTPLRGEAVHGPDRNLPRGFVATVLEEGAFRFVTVPFSPREVWGARPRFPVVGTIDGHPVRGCLGVDGSQYFLRLSTTWLREAGIAVGDEVRVELAAVEKGP